ncbi:odorant receptor 85b-like [Leguminivora glycinivorella]|uniref:odorant receptor 85b-like n=1 Tax=Leguminivora glycinivorella TaxID=1035111 RepID=UPI00200F855F|nr:odorant receptor 85b-like [Leguminivora glycinivorella]
MGEIAWMIRSILNGDFVQATYCAPCATLCFLGTVKTYYRIKCCDVIEAVFTKSSLFNFMASSLLLCLSGFNIMAYEDLAMLSNFLSFLFICLLQIYLMCDYGDKVSRASMDLSAAVYNSQWYNIDAKAAKNLLIILTRAQKPCKLTACKFAEINLGAFTRILSSSWSYFALLKSMYSRNSTLESTGKQ